MLLSAIARRPCAIARVFTATRRAGAPSLAETVGYRSCRVKAASYTRPMSSLPDVCGLPVVTSSWGAIKSLDQAYNEYVNLSGDPYQRTEEALDADPSCVMAHSLRGLLAALGQADPGAVATCLASAERALLDCGKGSGGEGEGERERVFVATLRAWSAGRWREGVLHLETWLMTSPQDLPALKLAQDAHLTLGDSANMRDCVGRVLPLWVEGTYGYGNVLGMHAFGLVETGSYGLAEERADVALALEPGDVWSVHAMAHVYEMEARASEGFSFLTDCRDKWEDKEGPLQQHMAWHLGLFSLERGQETRAQRIFDTLLAPPREGGKQAGALRMPPPAPFALTDACSLLWRMDILGVETGAQRWRGVAEAWLLYHHARHLSTFHDLHAVMAFTAMANGVDDSAEAYLWQARAEALVESMKDYVRSGGLRPTPEGLGGETPDAAQQPTPPGIVQLHSFSAGRNRGAVDAVGRRDTEELTVGNGGPGGAGAGPPDNLWVAEQVGVSLCEGMVAYRKGEFKEAVSMLLPLRYHLHAIGGSKAQQDVVHVTLLDAALRLPHKQSIARTLVCERRSQRPTSGRAWEAYATVMESEGNLREAFEARKVSFGFGIGQGGVGAN